MEGRRRYILRKQKVLEVADAHHLTLAQLATAVGLDRAYFSLLYNGRRPLTPIVRSKLVGSRFFSKLPETELWDIVPAEGAAQ